MNTIGKRTAGRLAAVIIAVSLLLIGLAFSTQSAHAEDIKTVNWNLTYSSDGSGVVTAANSSWSSTSGTAFYTMFLYKKGTSGSIANNNKGTATNFNVTSVLLKSGPGTYYVEGYAYNNSMMPVAHYKSDNLTLCKITIDTQGNGSNVVLNNVDGSTSPSTVIANSYVKSLGNPTEYYSQNKDKALVTFATKPQSALATKDDMWTNSLFFLGYGSYGLGSFPINTLISLNKFDGPEFTLYSVWYNVIKNVEVTVTAPACGESTTTNKSGKTWDWNSQTNMPVVSVPSGRGYHLAEAPYSWWENMDNSEPYVGQFTGGNNYRFETELVADYGYVFPGDNDGITINGTVNGGAYQEAFNSDDSYEYWLFDDDEGLYEVPLSVIGTVAVEHSYDNGVVTKEPTCDEKGERTYTCSGCNNTRIEDIDPLGYDVSGAEVTGITVKTYTGKAQTQSPVVKMKVREELRTLAEGTDYSVTYKNNINAGTASLTITGKGNYSGSITKTFTIAQAAQRMTAAKATRTVKAKKVRKSPQKVAGPVVKNALGAKSFKIAKVAKPKFKKNFKIDSKTGKITVKKGTKKGTYKVTVKVTAGGGNYKTVSKNAVVTIKVK